MLYHLAASPAVTLAYNICAVFRTSCSLLSLTHIYSHCPQIFRALWPFFPELRHVPVFKHVHRSEGRKGAEPGTNTGHIKKSYFCSRNKPSVPPRSGKIDEVWPARVQPDQYEQGWGLNRNRLTAHCPGYFFPALFEAQLCFLTH